MSTSYAILVFAIHLCFLSNCLVTESTHSLAKNLLKRPVLYACKVKSICILDNTVGLLIHQMPSNILIHISVAFPLISIRIHDFVELCDYCLVILVSLNGLIDKISVINY